MKTAHSGDNVGRSHGGGRADGDRLMVAQQVGEEPRAEMESQRARATGRIRRAKAEQMAPVTDAETGIQKATVEPERPRTEEEPEGRRSLTELEGWRDEA
ncbi:hypothetical protein QQF64_020124 [Cirrhinus molitorella]|uniref:Uncharacterized protein n=1 Tax=Cirrhinus molitorella TaxID=172907 RepID=A0ABR3LHF9_9TELE